jgi:Peptidase family M28
MNKFTFFLAFLAPLTCLAQTNIIATNPMAEQVLLGNYSPSTVAQAPPLDPAALGQALEAGISADSLKSYILKLASFKTRNSGSDTLSDVTGIGASRRWVLEKFNQFQVENGADLKNGYLQFDQAICGVGQHRNIMSVLPGSDPSSGFILIEGHFDSRCDVLCDTACVAEGVEDNATGTALVIELARVMSKWQFRNSIVFLVTTAEEQGLFGARAFANYTQQKSLLLRAVLNNDVIGGIICGKTSSAPSCPGLNNIDSTSVRLFSNGSFNSRHKQLARFLKLQYQENLLSTVQVPMNVRIMSPEDRTGRGGDHIPFREKGYPAMRFTAANEHGDASNNAAYMDRQHTSSDVLGVDTDMDGTVDSFFVDFNYLARNALINANGAAIAARNVGPVPDFTAVRSGNLLVMNINDPIDTQTFRIALRSLINDWDTVYTRSPAFSDVLYCNPVGPLYVSIATVDNYGAESLFGPEKLIMTSATEEQEQPAQKAIELYQNRPNPFDEATWISFYIHEMPKSSSSASIQISDLHGKIIENMPVVLKAGLNEVLYTHGYGVRGAFVYTLLVNGTPVDSRQMIFAN